MSSTVEGSVSTAAVPTSRIVVPFRGEGAGIGPMSWGQREIWLAMVRQNSALSLGGMRPLAPGTTVEDIADELAYLMSRYQSMRTRPRFDEEGRPLQELFDSGEIALNVYEAERGAAQSVAAEVEADWRVRNFDYDAEWPVRMAVVAEDGVPAYLVVFFSHFVMDGAGAEAMIREVTVGQSAPISGMQPAEQARWQTSPPGRRQNAAALRYWEKSLRGLPVQPAVASADPRSPRYWAGRLISPALRPAVNAIAQRTGTDTSAVLLALYAITVSKATAVAPVSLLSVISNRFRPGLADVVCPVAQSGMCVLDVADITVDEAVERARIGSVLACKYSYFDRDQLEALIDRTARERGAPFDIENYFNDRRTDESRQPPGTPITREELSAVPTAGPFEWIDPQDDPYERLFLHISDEPGGVMLFIQADTHYCGPSHVEAVARGIETIAIQAAFDPALPTGVSAARVGAGERRGTP